MEKWTFAIKHFWPSLIGYGRFFARQPAFALLLLAARVRYFLTRRFYPLIAPGGFQLGTPDSLVAFWVIVIERELYHPSWAETVKTGREPLVIDVGANAGVFSYFVYTLNPRSEIIAFEPLPALAARLRDLKNKTAINLTCFDTALSNQPGKAILQTDHGYDGTSRLVPGSEEKGISVRVSTLDELIPERRDITLIKIDVEGFEAEVLEGGSRTLSRTTYLIIECHTSAQKKRITAALGEGWREQRLGPCDFLFTNSSLD